MMPIRRLQRGLESPRLPWGLAALSIAFFLQALWGGLQADDFIYRAALTRADGLETYHRPAWNLFDFIDAERDPELFEDGFLPWWSQDDLSIRFFRPVTGWSHWLDYRLWPERPMLMHGHSLLWMAAIAVLITRLYRRWILPTWAAGLAALAFVLDDAHAIPVSWLANRNALISLALGLGVLLAHDRWRRDGWRAGAVWGPTLLLTALLANEGAVAVTGYLAAHALFLDPAGRRERLRSLVPYAAIAAGWWLAYRWAGYGVRSSGTYVDPGDAPLAFLAEVVHRLPLLFWGQWAFPGSDLASFLDDGGRRILWWVAVAGIAAVAWASWPLLRREPAARALALGMGLALLPACTAFPSDRILIFVGVGAMGLMSFLIADAFGPDGRRVGLPRRIFAGALVAIHLVLAPLSALWAMGRMGALNDVIVAAAGSLPEDAAVERQVLVMVNAPSAFLTVYGHLVGAGDGVPRADGAVLLGSGIYGMEVERTGPRSLAVRPRGGFLPPPGGPPPSADLQLPGVSLRRVLPMLDGLYRRDPLHLGWSRGMNGVRVEVTAMTDDGRAAEATFHFGADLDDRRWRWLDWNGGELAPFTPPAVGASVMLPPAALDLELR
ncbi:MAG: hypothetical protein AAGN66_17055 [Acidobacteriota bacterium]